MYDRIDIRKVRERTPPRAVGEQKMARFVSKRNPISAGALKRKAPGSVVMRHYGRTDVKFTRMAGGYKRERMDVTSSTTVVSSTAVASECNSAVGCKSSWARVY